MSKKYCQGFHPSTVIVCGPDPLSGVPPPCVKFPTNIISPTWNSINAKRIRSTRVTPEQKKDICTKTYQPAIKKFSICPDVVRAMSEDPDIYMLNIDQSGCECGPATITRFRVNFPEGPNEFLGVRLGNMNDPGMYTILPGDGCLSLSVAEQIELNQGTFLITLIYRDQNMDTVRSGYLGPCISLSAVTYTLSFTQDTEGICPDVVINDANPTPL